MGRTGGGWQKDISCHCSIQSCWQHGSYQKLLLPPCIPLPCPPGCFVMPLPKTLNDGVTIKSLPFSPPLMAPHCHTEQCAMSYIFTYARARKRMELFLLPFHKWGMEVHRNSMTSPVLPSLFLQAWSYPNH